MKPREYSQWPKRVKALPIYSKEWIDALEAKIHQRRRWFYAEDFRKLRERCGVIPKRRAS